MQISLTKETIARRKLMIATPLYGGQCFGTYMQSMINTAILFHSEGLALNYHFLSNESLITRARNYCADVFMRSDCTHLMFIDSDIQWNAEDIKFLLMLMDHENFEDPYDVVGACYPKKNISWEKIRQAVNKGLVDDQDPSLLTKYSGDFVFNPLGGTREARADLPLEVAELGTGFMMIKRSVFERFAQKYPHLSYKPDHVRTADFDGSREIMMYFQAEIDPDTKRYLSEDYNFCKQVRGFGGRIWVCPWMVLSHTGSYVYTGNFVETAKAGISLTVDPKLLKK